MKKNKLLELSLFGLLFTSYGFCNSNQDNNPYDSATQLDLESFKYDKEAEDGDFDQPFESYSVSVDLIEDKNRSEELPEIKEQQPYSTEDITKAKKANHNQQLSKKNETKITQVEPKLNISVDNTDNEKETSKEKIGKINQSIEKQNFITTKEEKKANESALSINADSFKNEKEAEEGDFDYSFDTFALDIDLVDSDKENTQPVNINSDDKSKYSQIKNSTLEVEFTDSPNSVRNDSTTQEYLSNNVGLGSEDNELKESGIKKISEVDNNRLKSLKKRNDSPYSTFLVDAESFKNDPEPEVGDFDQYFEKYPVSINLVENNTGDFKIIGENKFETYALLVNQISRKQNTYERNLLVSDYLIEVQNKGGAYPLVQEKMQVSKILSKEGGLYFSPYLKGKYSRIIDYSASWDQIFLSGYIVYLDTDNSDLTIEQQTPYGIDWKAFVSYYKTDLDYTSPTILGQRFLESTLGTSISNFSYGFGFEQSLWRNWMGKEIKAKAHQKKYTNLKDMYTSMHEMKGLMVQAQKAYWDLSIARERLKIHENTYFVSKSFSDFVRDKEKRHLTINLENQIAVAEVSEQELKIKKAALELQEKEETFNRLRGVPRNTPIPDVKPIEPFVMLYTPELSAPDNLKQKEEEMHLEYLQAKVDEGLEKLKPEFKWFSGVKGKDEKNTYENQPEVDTISNKPEYLIGIKMSLPLNFPLVKRVSKAYQSKRKLAQESYQYRKEDREKKYYTYLDEFKNLKEMAYILMELIEDQESMRITAEENYTQGLIKREDIVHIEKKISDSRISLMTIFENMTNMIFRMAYMD
jgi:hypothetical protein